MESLLEKTNNTINFHQMTECQIDKIQQTLINQFSLEWLKYLDNKPKLRTYCLFKRTFCTENYVMNTISRSRRSLFTQLRLGILPQEREISTICFVQPANLIIP